MPVEPPPSPWRLNVAHVRRGEDLAGVGADLAPGTVLAAYRSGLFPMGLGEHGAPPIGWWSPDPRGVLLPGDLHVSRSLRRAIGRYQIRVDTAFEQVVAHCADPTRPGRWITPPIVTAYLTLHRMGWAHSVETWREGRLVGGLYGLAIGGLFAGESMFHHDRDASKVALHALVRMLGEGGPARSPRWLVDVQWRTPHLASLGVREVSRARYLSLLASVLQQPLPEPFADGSDSAAPRGSWRPGTR